MALPGDAGLRAGRSAPAEPPDRGRGGSRSVRRRNARNVRGVWHRSSSSDASSKHLVASCY